jgi:hypothetical protein
MIVDPVVVDIDSLLAVDQGDNLFLVTYSRLGALFSRRRAS